MKEHNTCFLKKNLLEHGNASAYLLVGVRKEEKDYLRLISALVDSVKGGGRLSHYRFLLSLFSLLLVLEKRRLGVKLRAYSEAASLIEYGKDVKSLTIAAKLALLSNESVLNQSLAEQAIMETSKYSDASLVENIIFKYPQIKVKSIPFMSL
ncbi:gem-associated protein 5 isoform X2 [Vespula squamosa]|uniref:Gem-associated protein 5 isoform X2 n=1 Tax=Vespula squamosa TaxID=30214 RepID=A0ABD2BWG3_VESSQ